MRRRSKLVLFCLVALSFAARAAAQEESPRLDQPPTVATDAYSSLPTTPDRTASDVPAIAPAAKSGRRSNWNVKLEYLLWGLNDVDIPTLLTAEPVITPPGGSLTDRGRQTLIGNERGGDSPQSGLRVALERQLEDGLRFELGGWVLFQRSDDWSDAEAAEESIVSRPFLDATTGEPDAQVITFPGLADGAFSAKYQRRVFGVDPRLAFCLDGDPCQWLEGKIGYRYLRYEDALLMEE
ncbi:MAG: BBP7 family outer membrane beta-barrel protein, partial [Planctomycetota bacterium]